MQNCLQYKYAMLDSKPAYTAARKQGIQSTKRPRELVFLLKIYEHCSSRKYSIQSMIILLALLLLCTCIAPNSWRHHWYSLPMLLLLCCIPGCIWNIWLCSSGALCLLCLQSGVGILLFGIGGSFLSCRKRKTSRMRELRPRHIKLHI